MRWGTTAISLVLLAAEGVRGATLGWFAVILAFSAARTARPLRCRGGPAEIAGLTAELVLPALAVATTGGWESPLVFSVVPGVAIAGFARGLVVALGAAAAVALPISLVDLAGDGDGELAAQWAFELALVAIVAGYARRISGEADRQQSLALTRLGQLADANALLHSLHRVAQTLPASLDLDEALDTAAGRLRELFRYHAAALLLVDDTGPAHTNAGWTVARSDGARLPATLQPGGLPPVMAEAVDSAEASLCTNLDGEGLVAGSGSGLYGALVARGEIIGAVAIEHPEPGFYGDREIALLRGFLEPAALAIDNARWFGRLRMVGAEEERTRIARDLHDRIGQSLAFLAFELDRLVKIAGRGDDVAAALDTLRADVRRVTTEVRETLYDLRTEVTETQGLAEVLTSYVRRVADRSGMIAELDTQEADRLPLAQERELFRIAQESLTNVEKHSGAHNVRVAWHCNGRSAALEVIDDGAGFGSGDNGRSDSYGLVGMRERAARIGATLDVVSAPGQGTVVRCVLDDGGDGTATRIASRA